MVEKSAHRELAPLSPDWSVSIDLLLWANWYSLWTRLPVGEAGCSLFAILSAARSINDRLRLAAAARRAPIDRRFWELPDSENRTLKLGVNIDHIATLRQARYATMPESKNVEPDPIAAAAICERAGASGIVAHLRTDRRHIQDRDIDRLRQNIMTKLNLEMGNTPEIVDVALRVVPDEVCLVPEKREEVTTEGGLDVIAHRRELEATIKRLHVAGIRVSLFIDPDLEQIDAAGELGVEMVELHTGKLANAFTDKIEKQEIENLQAAARCAFELDMQVNAGHGINYTNIASVKKVPHLTELNIGHAIVSRAIFVGLENAVREMLIAMEDYKK
jgi:pyridoxine 5-phosphate synthase